MVGGGISGLASAHLLSARHEVHLFEREPRLGGHTHTVMAESSTGPVALDTGFLVHNDRTYRLLIRLFAELDVPCATSDMSFSVSCPRTGFEYSSRGLRGFFAQRRNLWSREHLVLLSEIRRFNREGARALRSSAVDRMTLGEFLAAGRFTDLFVDRYLAPMASAIWSASPEAIGSFPAATLMRFLANHGLLSISDQPVWRVVRGGSSSYIPKLTARFARRIRVGTSIESITRHDRGVTVRLAGGVTADFDEVVFACHGDQVLPLLADPSDAEREVFSGFKTTANTVVLHTDTSVLPARADARASWNYRLRPDRDGAPTVTYHLNRLQSLDTPEQFCVTLNPDGIVRDDQVLRTMVYRHPLYDHAAIRSQDRWGEVSGVRRTHYCGAYWYYGFHEDGLRSAVRVAAALGVRW